MTANDKLDLYLEDANEQLDGIETDILLLEEAESGVDSELINRIFRSIHTVKGGAGFLGLQQIRDLSHVMEDVLDRIRADELQPNHEQATLLLTSLDMLKSMLEDTEKTFDIADCLLQLQQYFDEKTADHNAQTTSISGDTDLGIPEFPALFSMDAVDIDDYQQKGFELFVLSFNYAIDSKHSHIDHEAIFEELDAVGYILDSSINPVEVSEDVSFESEDNTSPFFALFATVLSKSLLIHQLDIAPSQVHSHSSDENLEHMHALVAEEKIATPEIDTTYDAPPPSQPIKKVDVMDTKVATATANAESEADKKTPAVNSIRVSVDILDSLMNLAGELVLTRNQLNQNVMTWDQYAIGVAAQRLDSVTSELQASIMDTRMQPIGTVFTKFQRVVRDMSNKLGKQIRFEIEGEEVELDKTIIENIGDPLTHLVRNAIDHGLETTTERERIGKDPVGLLKLSAQHEAGYVLIKIQDDGNGIDAEVIKAKALEKGLADKTRLDEMSDKEIIKFIFEPGFSTAAAVTDISGRGVGMDVVFTNLSQLGGTIDIDTSVGQGSTFQVKLPLTLAIIPCLLVAVNKERYALPQVSLVELVRIPPAQVKQRLERIGESVVVRLRGNLLPILRLRDFLNIDGDISPEQAFDGSQSINIVVVSAGDFRYGIVVDDLLDSEEIVVKPLGQHVRDCAGYAGATILGDGCAALILDVIGIANYMNLSTDEIDKENMLKKAQEAAGEEQSLLIIENSPKEQFAIQLSYIHRIERITQDEIQNVGNKSVIKYRGGTLRLYFLHDALKVSNIGNQKHLFLVIFPIDGVEVAVVANNILDIIDTHLDVDKNTFKQAGVIGSAIIEDNITLLLDLFGIVRSISSDYALPDPAMPIIKPADTSTVLVVEDSKFFRAQVKSLLEDNDYNVILAEDGELGLQALQRHGDEIDLVISDIEMPNMTGLEMTEKIRGLDNFKNIPILILSTLTSDDDMVKGHTAGVTEYMVKMDQELVLNTVMKYLNPMNIGNAYDQYGQHEQPQYTQ